MRVLSGNWRRSRRGSSPSGASMPFAGGYVALTLFFFGATTPSLAIPNSQYEEIFVGSVLSTVVFEPDPGFAAATALNASRRELLEGRKFLDDNGQALRVADYGAGIGDGLALYRRHSLDRDDRNALRSLYSALSGPSQRPGDLLGELARDIDRFYLETAHINEKKSPLDPETAAASGESPIQNDNAQNVLIITPLRQRDPSGRSTSFGALAVEMLKPEVLANDFLLTTTSGLRQFFLVEQRRSSLVMMLESTSGHTMMVTTLNAPMTSHSGPSGADNWKGQRPMANARAETMSKADGEHSHRQAVWDTLTSTLAQIIYAILLLCWAAWRYGISRYV